MASTEPTRRYVSGNEARGNDSESAPDYDNKIGNDKYNAGEEEEDVGNTYTVDEAIDAMGYGKFQNILYFVCGVGFIADAAELMLLSFLLPAVKEEFKLSSLQVSFLGSCIFVGMFLGASFWGRVSDLYGRRTAFILSIFFTVVWGFGSAFAPGFYWLLVLRTLTGFGVAGNHAVFSLFAEYVPSKGRGVHLSFVQMFWSLGAILEAALAWWLLPTKGWRWLLAASALPLVFSIITFPWLPESPRYLVVSDRIKEAEQLLEKVAITNQKPLPDGVLTPVVSHEVSNFKILFHPYLIKSTLLMWGIWFTCTFSYYGIVLLTPEFLQEHKDERIEDANYGKIMLATLPEIPGVLLAATLLATADRIPSLGASLFFTGSFFLALMSWTSVSWGVTMTFLAGCRIAVVSAFTIVYVYTLELYPTTVRSTGLGSCSSIARIAGMLTPIVADVMWQWNWIPTLILYASIGILAGCATMLLTVETNNEGLPDGVEAMGSSSADMSDHQPLLI